MVQSISKSYHPPDLAPRVSYPSFGTRAGLGGLSVAGVEEEERKRKKKREGVIGLRPYLDLLAPSAANPRVVNLRAARVKPDHRSSACGQALNLVGAPLLDLCQRRADAHHLFWICANGERAHRRGVRAAPRARSLRRRSSAARVARCGA
jgi:hypothetical protein